MDLLSSEKNLETVWCTNYEDIQEAGEPACPDELTIFIIEMKRVDKVLGALLT